MAELRGFSFSPIRGLLQWMSQVMCHIHWTRPQIGPKRLEFLSNQSLASVVSQTVPEVVFIIMVECSNRYSNATTEGEWVPDLYPFTGASVHSCNCVYVCVYKLFLFHTQVKHTGLFKCFEYPCWDFQPQGSTIDSRPKDIRIAYIHTVV